MSTGRKKVPATGQFVKLNHVRLCFVLKTPKIRLLQQEVFFNEELLVEEVSVVKHFCPVKIKSVQMNTFHFTKRSICTLFKPPNTRCQTMYAYINLRRR